LSTPAAPAPRGRRLARGNEPASPGAVGARRRAVAAKRGTRRDERSVETVFSVFDELAKAALRDFSVRTPLLARNITGQYEGRTASARPGQAIMTESRSTAAHRKTVAALAILALACKPCGAFLTALARSRLRRADRRSD
jgi:hypothetical protein